MEWIKKSLKDNGGFWTDHISVNGDFLIAQGYNEIEKKQGNSWTLFDCSQPKWKTLGFFKTPEDAKIYLMQSVISKAG